MINLVSNLFEEKAELRIEEISELFKKLHGIDVPQEKLEEALKFAEKRKVFKRRGEIWTR